VPKRWEYLLLYQQREWDGSTWPITSWIRTPGESDATEYDNDSAFEILQILGAEGWELSGQPAYFSVVTGLPAKNPKGESIHLDAADWFRREFWFKREVTDE
jgi:hypothetical protein